MDNLDYTSHAHISAVRLLPMVISQPTPQSLRDDGTAVGKHIISEVGYSSLVIHGESIGGLASSGAARALSQSTTTKDVLSLLICDRTFCNLEATAQRLVGAFTRCSSFSMTVWYLLSLTVLSACPTTGSWTGPAIFALAPFWNMDVTGDFLAADCHKIVANDSADAIIADASSLKAGVSLSREISRGEPTRRLGWMTEAPLTYRMADWENVGVNGELSFSRKLVLFPCCLASPRTPNAHSFPFYTTDSAYVKSSFVSIMPPIWPKDRNITPEEAFHFAACVRRIGKVATAEKKSKSDNGDEEEGFESNGLESRQNDVGSDDEGVSAVWKMLACCDGLCGTPLGFPVKNSFDSTVSWLCCTLTFGGQRVAAAAEKRTEGLAQPARVIAADFDSRHVGFQEEESNIMFYPKPIPEVMDGLKRAVASENAAIKSGKSL